MRQKRTFPFAGKSNSLGAKRKSAKASAMSLTRQEPTAAKKQSKSRRQDLAAVLVEREAELAEVRRQHAATAEILKVIAASPTDVQPVFEAIAARANRLIGGFSTAVFRIFGDAVHLAAFTSVNAKADEALKAMFPLPRAQFPGLESISRGDSAQVTDTELDAGVRDLARLRGYRSILFTPLLSNGAPIGIISVTREAPGAFSAHQVQLLQTFADQAVIAVNNVGLFNETQEALKQQTATAEILKVIASSPSDVRPVFEAVADRARNLLDCWSALVVRFDGEQAHFGAARGALPDTEEFVRQQYPTRPEPESTLGRCLLERVAINHPNLQTGESPTLREYARTRGFRAVMSVPMLQDGQPIGAIIVTRQKAGDFAAREAALLQTFAAQAAIAIENTRLFNETKEALAQQTATTDVLKVISRSAFDLQSVLDALVESAARLCEAEKGCIMQRHGDHYHWVSNFGFSAEHEAYVRAHPMAAGGHSATARVARDRRAVHIPDVLADPDYTASENQRLGDYRTILGVPLLRDGEPIGAFIMTREVVRPFNQRQIDLLQTFADQAVIAIENARLFDEVQVRTRDLEDSLQQQMATADVLKVISRSAFDLQAVFETLLDSAIALSGAWQGTICIRDGDAFTYRAVRTAVGTEEFDDQTRTRLLNHEAKADRTTLAGRAVLSGKVEQIEDIFEDPEYWLQGGAAETAGIRAVLGVPLLRNDRAEGALVLSRRQPGRYSPSVVELIRTFADQAVIAIENARLFGEVQAKTRDLEESLQQQTATADVLKVISRSAFDLDAVFDALLTSAVSLVGSRGGTICVREGDRFRYRAVAEGRDSAMWRYLSEHPPAPGRASVAGRVLLSGKPEIITDSLLDNDLKVPVHALAGSRSVAGVPLLREDKVEGALMVGRAEPGPFDSRQIELLQTFADQAVIAIENVRLFDEVQARTRDLSEALMQQTATADVLKAISRSAFDLDTVLETLIATALRLCDATYGEIFRRHGDFYRYAASRMDVDPAYLRHERAAEIAPGRGTLVGRVALENRAVEIVDAWTDPEYAEKEEARVGNVRAMLGVPLMRDGEMIGAFALGRAEPIPFSQRQVDLVATFADQAVIAIENVRLFDEVQAKTRDLEESLQQQTATANVLKVISRSAFDLQAVLTTLAESARDLCGASFVTLSLREGDAMRLRAESGCTPEIVQFMGAHPIRAGRETFTGRVMLSGEAVHLPDVFADPEYDFGEGPRIGNYRALLAVPLLRDGQVEGVFALARPEPAPFTERQIEMVRAFADQAVIAIENSRLFEEVQARTRELVASLDDLRKAQDRLIQSEKLASLGQLTAGIAHEIKNPLNFINNYSALSRELVDELAEAIKGVAVNEAAHGEADDLIGAIGGNLDKILQHGKRADSIVKNMLLHSREGSGERSTTNVNAMVEEALNLAYHGARAEKPGFNVTIVKSLDPNAGAAEVYAQEMTRVLLNLISNGFYATSKRKQSAADGAYEPTISASTRDLGPKVEIAIRDNGPGIPDEVKAKMFNPFFTTKSAGEGTGLGLSLSHDIVVKQHGGAIEVSTEPNAFTEFSIVLPRGAPGL
jgi:GAF domain-containing protein